MPCAPPAPRPWPGEGSAGPRPARDATYLVCACGAERYGLPLAEAAGVLPMRPCTPVPGAVPALLGLAAVSGRIVSVLDLARALGRPVRAPPPAATSSPCAPGRCPSPSRSIA